MLKPEKRTVPFNNIRLHLITNDSPYFEGAVEIYAQTWRQDWEDSYSFFLRHALYYPDYHACVAVIDAEKGELVVGMGFGNRSEPGHWWHDCIAQHVGISHPALQNAWALTELAIRDGYRGYGVGTLVHDALLASHSLPRALLSTEVSNERARRFYEWHKWQYLHPGFLFGAGRNPYAILRKELR